MEEKFKMIAHAGFDGIDAFVPKPDEAAAWRESLDRHRLALSVNAYPSSADDLRRELELAAGFGGIRAVNVQVMTPFLTGEAAIRLLEDIAALAGEYGLSVNVETHRGTITQDLIRTADYVQYIPELRLTADFSHYVLAGEMPRIPDEAENLFRQLLSRADCLHGRVSNGEQIQVGCFADEEHPMLAHYGRWWELAMRGWLERYANGVVNGDSDGGALLFIPELGPPPYAITTEVPGSRGVELNDRWQQSLALAAYARRLWDGVLLSEHNGAENE
ncbi:xylose isomerase-like TIM barrel protein [Paenibacillus methanolicus]|uniref:Xylose isomerase-like TIM barrel protein n=2 Tax=Paenibacillus methanolicus TaxID=582686 RepID=A0A5S5C860_9BACL|nr:xylose isomerase-like TIM barrel protein [Paenibacillus methanolicus]